MKSSNFIVVIFAIFFVVASCKTNQKQNQSKPNILFIAVDDLRTEINCYGNSYIKSPNLDKLAVEYGKNLQVNVDRNELESRLAQYARPDVLPWARPGYVDGGIVV